MGNSITNRSASPFAYALLAGVFFFWSASATAQVDQDVTFSGAFGVEYDDNITVPQIDAETNQGDGAGMFEAGVDYEADFGDAGVFTAGYSFSASEQFDLSDFDFMLNGLSAGYSRDVGPVNAGVTYRFFNARLGGDNLLDIHSITPYVSAFPHKRLYLRGEYSYQDKDLKNRTARDAETHSGQVSSFVFIDGTDTYLTGKAGYEDEDAKGPEFDFDAVILAGGVKTRLPFGGADNRFSVDLEYESRDYKAVTPSIGEIRDDERTTFELGWRVPFGTRYYVEAEYQYRDFSSNLASSNFTENLGALTFGFEF